MIIEWSISALRKSFSDIFGPSNNVRAKVECDAAKLGDMLAEARDAAKVECVDANEDGFDTCGGCDKV